MLSHDTVLPSTHQVSRQEATAILDQVASLLLGTLDLCHLPTDATLADPRLIKRGRGRPIQLPWTQLWGSLLLCALGGMRSFADWRRFVGTERLGGLDPMWVSTNALVKRLLKAGLPPLEELWVLLNDRIGCRVPGLQPPALAPFASRILCLDETKLDRLARHLKPLRDLPSKDPALFAGKLLGLFDLRAQRWLWLEWREKMTDNSLVDLLPFLEGLVKGTLVLFDLGYFSFLFFDTLTERGIWWISRYREGTSYQLVHTFYRHQEVLDALVWLGTRSQHTGHLARLVRFGDGVKIRMYLTNVTDPLLLPLLDIPHLYARRWDIELAFRLLKDYLDLRHFWSSKPELVKVQIWVLLILSQVVMAKRSHLAQVADCDLFEISIPLLIKQLPTLSQQPQALLETILAQGSNLGILRPTLRLCFSLELPHVCLEQYLPVPADLQRQRTPKSRCYAPRKRVSGPSDYQKKLAKAEATKQTKAQRCAQTKAVKAALLASGFS